jgi:fructan beta-fructosidase
MEASTNIAPGTSLADLADPYRPTYHFTPASGWMNDPNGLVYFDGEYHLFYQHLFPSHWGHAVSTDLLHWTHLPIALVPDERGLIASGSAVVDWNDTSGFFDGKPGLVAIFTHWRDDAQEQSIAYSADKGRTWTKWSGNPVVPNPGIPDFRDPKVVWHAPTQRWVMVVAVRDRVHFYISPNLKEWTFASEFGADEGSHAGVWECPDLVELPVAGVPNLRKWTLHVSVNYRHGKAMQYFVGTFDGKRFVNENDPTATLWTDYGVDYYAAVTWANLALGDERRIWIGWLNNWTYARKIPTHMGQGMLSIPRQLGLKQTSEGVRLTQTPITELRTLRRQEHVWTDHVLAPGHNLLEGIHGKSVEIIAELEPGTATAVGFNVRKKNAEYTTISYDPQSLSVSVDRSTSGITDFDPAFPGKHTAFLLSSGSNVMLHIFLDQCSIEVFANDGEAVISDLIFPGRESDALEIFARGGEAFLTSLAIYQLRI